MPESKVISLDKRAEDEEKPFLEQLLQEGARKLLQTARNTFVPDAINSKIELLWPWMRLLE